MRLKTTLGLTSLFALACLLGIYLSSPSDSTPKIATPETRATPQKAASAEVRFVKIATLPKAEPVAASSASSDVLERFDNWTKNYLQAGKTEKADLIAKGQKLAEERRPVFKALIIEDPREAIQKAVPMVVRQKLPAEVVALLEQRMNHIGAIRVMQGVPLDLNDPPEPTYREVELEKVGTYRAYVYGERANKLTWTAGASVNGVAMDSEFAISDDPTRRLEVGERLPEGKTVIASCPVSGKSVVDPKDVPAVVPESLPAVETPTEIITFCDGSHIAVQNQT
ncbi:MAG: hypothetical protein NTV80_25010, partial [Verrucomicrobia bacterium]|nr:hypothetical protein [Verrucomicrobiota bacterium]